MPKTTRLLPAALALAALPVAAFAQDHADHSAHSAARHAEHMQHAEAGHHAMPYHDAEDRAAVLGVVEAFMAGLAARDAEAMSALVTEPGFLAMVEGREGGDRTALDSMEEVIESLANIPVPVEEPIYDPHVMSDGLVAMVWAPYDFLIQGNRSHCGVDIFSLIKVDGEWKIATVTYSHFAADTCPER